MSNRQNGGRFEIELSRTLSEHGFWCHLMQQSKSGQPADIIAVKNGYHTLIDCKVISGGVSFPFSRVEENQKYAMNRFRQRCGEVCWFALKLPDGSIRMLSSQAIMRMERGGKKSLTGEELYQRTNELDAWLHYAEVLSFR